MVPAQQHCPRDRYTPEYKDESPGQVFTHSDYEGHTPEYKDEGPGQVLLLSDYERLGGPDGVAQHTVQLLVLHLAAAVPLLLPASVPEHYSYLYIINIDFIETFLLSD